MDPSKWGRCLWRAIHVIALGYPDEPSELDRVNYKNYYRELWTVLPCFKCSVNYKRHLEELPIDGFLDSKIKLFEWTVRLHNIVNRELGKREISVEEAWSVHTGELIGVSAAQRSRLWASAIVAVVLLGICLLVVTRKKAA